MITKVLQALANNVRFGAKEPGMRKLNDFMDGAPVPSLAHLKSTDKFSTAVNIFGMPLLLHVIPQSADTFDVIRHDSLPSSDLCAWFARLCRGTLYLRQPPQQHFNRADEGLTSLRDDVVPEDNVGLDDTDKSFLHQFLHDNMDK